MEGEHVGPFNLGNPGEFTILELAQVSVPRTNFHHALYLVDELDDLWGSASSVAETVFVKFGWH